MLGHSTGEFVNMMIRLNDYRFAIFSKKKLKQTPKEFKHWEKIRIESNFANNSRFEDKCQQQTNKYYMFLCQIKLKL